MQAMMNSAGASQAVIDRILPPKVNCSTVLPNGQTLGQFVQSEIANIENAAGPFDMGPGTLGAFYEIVKRRAKGTPYGRRKGTPFSLSSSGEARSPQLAQRVAAG